MSNNSKNFENCNNETEQNSTFGGFNFSNTNNTDKQRDKSIQNLKLNKGATNHTFYESKSFSNKKVNEKIKSKTFNSYNNCHDFNYTFGPNTTRYRIDNKSGKNNYNQQKTINPNRFYFYKCAIDNYKDTKK